MTVKQLINKLKKYPEDANVVLDNDESCIDDIYFATSVEEYEEGVVLIATDYKKRLKNWYEDCDESIRELEKARDSIEPCLFIDEALDQSMKTAIKIMRKYQKIQQIMEDYQRYPMDCLFNVREVIEDGNDKSRSN